MIFWSVCGPRSSRAGSARREDAFAAAQNASRVSRDLFPLARVVFVPTDAMRATRARLAGGARRLLLAVLVAVGTRLARPTCEADSLYSTYAAEAAGRGSSDVRAWLHDRASAHHVSRTYSQAWTDLERIDAHNDTHVNVIYGGFAPKCRTGAFYGDRCVWNREHLWPQSYGVGESSGLPASAVPRADMHALVPSVAALNSARSNRAFVDVLDRDGATCASDFAGCETPACTSTACGVRGTAQYGDDTWTPPVEKRGFIARAMLYMDVRYDGDEPDTFDLRLGELDEMRRDEATGTFVFAALSDILRWHETHPVERWERERNDEVCGKQGNRNPFVDKPELVEVVFGNATAAAARAHANADASAADRAWTVVAALVVTWALYVFGMFRWYV